MGVVRTAPSVQCFVSSDGVGLKKQQIMDMIVSRCNGGHALEDVFLGIPGFDSKFAESIRGFISDRVACDI